LLIVTPGRWDVSHGCSRHPAAPVLRTATTQTAQKDDVRHSIPLLIYDVVIYFIHTLCFCYLSIIVLDEIDGLLTRAQTVLYRLFDWPKQAGSRLILIGN
jgi:hypothetical protein